MTPTSMTYTNGSNTLRVLISVVIIRVLSNGLTIRFPTLQMLELTCTFGIDVRSDFNLW